MRLNYKARLFSVESLPSGAYDAEYKTHFLGEARCLIIPVSAARYSDDRIQFGEQNTVTHRVYMPRRCASDGCKSLIACERWYRVINQTETRQLPGSKPGRLWYAVLNCALVHRKVSEVLNSGPIYAL